MKSDNIGSSYRYCNIDTSKNPRWSTITLFSFLPFLAVLHPYAVFPIYVLISILTFRSVTWIPLLIILKLVVFAILIFHYQSSEQTIINILSIISADIFAMTLGIYFSRFPTEDILYSISKSCVLIIFLGFIVSILLNSIGFDVADPRGFLDGKRFLILSKITAGHSIAIELATVALAFLLAGYRRFKYHAAFVCALFLVLVISRSSSALLCLTAILSVALIEKSFKSRMLGNFIHLLIFFIGLYIASDPIFFNEFMRWFRVYIVGQDAITYRDGDFSAGRAMLNAMMFQVAGNSPWFGVGHEHPYLVMGVQALTGEVGANSETPLRLAAKYGWPVFIVSVATICIPLLYGLRSFGAERRFFTTLGYCILIMASGNGSFSIAQSPYYIIYAPLIWLAWSRGFSVRKIGSPLQSFRAAF